MLNFGVTPWQSLKKLKRDYDPLMDYLNKQTGYKINFQVVKSSEAQGNKIKQGKIDFGLFTPFAYIIAKVGNLKSFNSSDSNQCGMKTLSD